MGYVTMLAGFPTKTKAYVIALMATLGFDTPNAIIGAIVDGQTPDAITAMTAAEVLAQFPHGANVGTPLALEQVLIGFYEAGTIPDVVTTFEGLLP